MKRILYATLVMSTVLPFHPALADVDAGMDALFSFDHQTAIAEFEPSAEQGDVNALFWAGSLYLNPEASFANRSKGLSYLKQASEQGHIVAMRSLGQHYEQANNYEASASWFQKAALNGDEASAIALCGDIIPNLPENGLNQDRFVQALIKAGSNGSPTAQFVLGKLLIFGRCGQKQNRPQAFGWILKAAEAGYPKALSVASVILRTGEGNIKRDTARSLDYLTRAAELGDISAKSDLAGYYQKGNTDLSIRKNSQTALFWYETIMLQVRRGDFDSYEYGLHWHEASKSVAELQKALSNSEIAAVKNRAKAWIEKHSSR